MNMVVINVSLRTILIVAMIMSPVAWAQEETLSATLSGPIPARVIRVIDGDTFVARAHIWIQQEVEVFVRIRGIDAPELKGKCEKERRLAVAAKQRLIQLVEDGPAKGQPVLLHQVAADKYGGRVVATVLLERPNAPSLDVGAMLLQDGLVRPYNGAKRLSWCL